MGSFSNESAFFSRTAPPHLHPLPQGERKQGGAITGDTNPARGEEARLGNDWRCQIAKSTLSIHAFFFNKPSSIKSKMQLGKKSY